MMGNIYYYYCSMQTFESMLKTKSLWLTNLTESTDYEEVNRLYNNLWKRIKEQLNKLDLEDELLQGQLDMLDSTFSIQEVVDIPYGCCFCAENDLVQQWKE